MRKILVLGLLFGTIVAWSSGCTGDDDDDDDHVAPDSVEVTPANPTVAVGSSQQMVATGYIGSNAEIVTDDSTWTSSSAGVATVSATGLVTGVSAGTTTITATHDGVSGSTTATVVGSGVSSLTFTGTAWPHDGSTAFVRILLMGVVVDCQESAAIAGNAFSINYGAILNTGTTYTYETFADLNNDGNYENSGADHRWTGTFTPTTASHTEDVNHGETQGALTWANNAGCPGT